MTLVYRDCQIYQIHHTRDHGNERSFCTGDDKICFQQHHHTKTDVGCTFPQDFSRKYKKDLHQQSFNTYITSCHARFE
ncbi:hypothetical protein M8C21_021020 [Ambrosia artemisiifolia]|uniref:Uncharacterized protein n=1 Tax=Ambrosia artemisiifolia TaxID=4212 RepID=A0AAD5BKC8_AMBAR|nr:hypothetical protein M8C21_021020 [Ambrosia artemisiifolia]